MENEKKLAGYISKKVVALILVLVLALGGVIGGTFAWLVAKSDPVVNTFTYGDINIDLEETDTGLDEDENPDTNDYKMIPGQEIPKDPTVTVQDGSESCWLFVKLKKSANFDDFMDYDMADGWSLLDGTDNVYFRRVMADDAEKEFEVIANNTVTVKESVTKEMLNALDLDNYPKLTIRAYAVQYAGFETADISDEQATQTAAGNAWEQT